MVHNEQQQGSGRGGAYSQFLERMENGFLGLILIVMMVLILAQVYFRFFTESSLTWSEELSRFLMIWMTFLGSAVALRRNEHIQIDNLLKTNKLSNGARKGILILRGVLMIAFLVSMFYGTLTLMQITGFQKSPSMQISMTYVYAVIPISSLLMVIYAIRELVKSIRSRHRRFPIDDRVQEEMIQ
ncbi:TRAP transporter small permease [Ammoniphilus resinae]|uniref:TRAP-type C4-dicarboxylate transport system permease small subunit n=1 Tax=Ammoniphilus resinae TaxID=861532 RepID=A0ABS4GXL8_9BACL|nr:TRAP transporter small permease [Ammoniphilus resinae]MBP1935004.1 TRAP-type C4-dicarboxylate transport system permease small subunit [Ammoniphilus resinae]